MTRWKSDEQTANLRGRFNLAHQALQHLARTALDEFGGSVTEHIADRLCPSDRRRQLVNQVLADFIKIG